MRSLRIKKITALHSWGAHLYRVMRRNKIELCIPLEWASVSPV